MTLTKLSAAASVLLLVAVLAPSARAQGLAGAGDLTGGAGGAAGGVTDTVGGTAGGVTDTAGGAAGGVTDALDGTTAGTTATVGGTTGEVTGAVGGATSGGGTTDVGGTIGDTVGGVTDTAGGADGGGIPDVGGTVGNTLGGDTDGSGGGGATTDPVTGTVAGLTGNQGTGASSSGGSSSILDGLLGGSGGSNVPTLEDLTPALLDDLVEQASVNGLSPAAAEGWIDGKKVVGAASYRSARSALASLSSLMADISENVVAGGASSATTAPTVRMSEPDGESFFASAGRAAVQAAKALAFPLALALLVVGFLVAQGRIGRKDPKLVLAPVDTREESLTFE